MPFHLRLVQPVYVCRLASPYAQAPSDGISLVCNSLEDINSLSLLRIVRQLSDISRHAEDILSNIHFQASALGDRSTRLQNRISFLQHMISHLDHRRVPVRNAHAPTNKEDVRPTNLDLGGRGAAAWRASPPKGWQASLPTPSNC
ncbi:hypothetical protein XELAEV_18027091mg [Xenopus laevis]|uniref:Uncharacterized protein n=1 Tax=Xenopus laevis TaxID=8355 RepID=A0A974CVK2_XENLA|nr:hypothetical protein XELAEV_18027091mg [Xenopus laevis]